MAASPTRSPTASGRSRAASRCGSTSTSCRRRRRRRRRGLRRGPQADGRRGARRRRRARRRDARHARQPARRSPRRRRRGRRADRTVTPTTARTSRATARARLRLRPAAVLPARCDAQDVGRVGPRPVPVAGALAEGDGVGASRSSICPATRRAASACGAPPTGWRSRTTASPSFTPPSPLPGRRPRVPHPAFNWSTERCAESIAKLAALEPATCWPAHYGPLTGDVAARLRAAI